MDDYRWNHHHYHHNHVPAFGSWDYGDEMPYTQCFETANNRQPGLVRYDSYSHEDRDLYVAGDLYQNDVVTPAVILVPRRRRKGERLGYPNAKKEKKQIENEWGYSYDIKKEVPSPLVSPPRPHKSKAVDEDLYQIPPEFLHVKPKRKRGLGLFSSCLLPACV